MLVRDASEGMHVLMVRRSARSSFAPDAFVFPGGTVDDEDFATAVGFDDARIGATFRAAKPPELPTDVPPVDSAQSRALLAAAVREVREEAAIELAAEHLELFSHWITPPTEPRRYDTHFFIAHAPEGAIGEADAHETHDARWLAPAAALAAHARGEIHLVYPTIKHLERLAPFARAEDALAFARSKPILTIMPSCAPSEGFVMPASLEGRW